MNTIRVVTISVAWYLDYFENKKGVYFFLDFGDFSEQAHDGKLPEYWEVLTFDGIERYSSYRHMYDGEVWSVQAVSCGGSSGLIRRVAIDPKLYSQVSFRREIKGIIALADITLKNTDDAPASVFWQVFVREKSIVKNDTHLLT